MTYPGMIYPGMNVPPLGYRQPDRYPKMWFGNFGHMEWIDTPRAGADVSPEGWSSAGTTLSGGGYVVQSPGSHKNYNFEWKATSAREMAQKMQDYRSGVFSHNSFNGNLLYFVDPLTYTTNMLPAIWAHPAEAFTPNNSQGYRDYSHPFGTVEALPTTTPNRQQYGLPSRGVQVVDAFVDSVSENKVPSRNTLFLPMPGYSLDSHLETEMSVVFWVEDASSVSGMFGRKVYENGLIGPEEKLEPAIGGSFLHEMNLTQTSSSQIVGALLYTKGSNFQIYGGRAVMTKIKGRELEPIEFHLGTSNVKWFGGQGNSGCKIDGNPSYVNNNSVDGGQISYAATLKEVGSWIQ